MTQRHPQLILTLSPQGGLVIELPGHMGTRRQLTVRDGELAETVHRILAAQSQDQTEIGLDGAPTQAQVRHWERHGIWADAQCRFCQSEGRAHPTGPRRDAPPKRKLVSVDRAGVEVRRIRTGQGAARVIKSRKTAEDLGL